ncbi:hypothetical protein R70006_05033 [Paraburkholderia domus]|uniref:hypothetical protein n=1 Tax=Paraburkholderia domus TaxID=2793075 RepID=UPI0019148F52|nr:hypothetical protein [Paraburkholderia domus]MBK5051730.1 hypothetical protein [Burkholderia sp. R-70006]CAE6795061.1 hypothetical protein R70006_05033 [Paraburkholderia domus]
MNQNAAESGLTREQVLVELTALGEDPAASRVDAVRSRIVMPDANSGVREAAIRNAVDVARVEVDALVASQSANAEGAGRFRDPSRSSPHYEFWTHIKAGGRVWRDDTSNDVQEWLDLKRLGGDPNEIQRYGYANLSIQPIDLERGKSVAADVLPDILVAVKNAYGFLSRKVWDRRLTSTERSQVLGATQGLAAAERDLGMSKPVSAQQLYHCIEKAHDVANEIYATPNSADGRDGMGTVNDLRVAMTILRHGAEAAASKLPIGQRSYPAFEIYRLGGRIDSAYGDRTHGKGALDEIARGERALDFYGVDVTSGERFLSFAGVTELKKRGVALDQFLATQSVAHGQSDAERAVQDEAASTDEVNRVMSRYGAPIEAYVTLGRFEWPYFVLEVDGRPQFCAQDDDTSYTMQGDATTADHVAALRAEHGYHAVRAVPADAILNPRAALPRELVAVDDDELRIELGHTEESQQGAFQNGTLQPAGKRCAMTIQTFVDIPAELAAADEWKIAAYLKEVLQQASAATAGNLKFEVQIGASRDAEQEISADTSPSPGV